MESSTIAPPNGAEAPPSAEDNDGLGPASSTDLGQGAPEGSEHGDTNPPTPPADLGQGDGDEEGPALEGSMFLVGNRALTVKIGGRKPDSSILKFKGAKVDLDGAFDRGDRITTVDVWQVTGDNDQDSIETQSGKVKTTSKTQNATLCGTSTLADYLTLKLADTELLAPVLTALGLDEE